MDAAKLEIAINNQETLGKQTELLRRQTEFMAIQTEINKKNHQVTKQQTLFNKVLALATSILAMGVLFQLAEEYLNTSGELYGVTIAVLIVVVIMLGVLLIKYLAHID